MAAVIVRARSRHLRDGDETRRLETAAIRIGRAPANDIVLSDPFVGPAQFRLLRDDEDIVLEVLDRTNPVFVNGRRRDEARIVLTSGDWIEVGHSRVHVLREDAVVPPARVLPSSWWSRLGSGRPALAAALLVFAGAVNLWLDFLATVDAPRWAELLYGTVSLMALLTGWSAFWAMVGRSIRQQAQFAGHLALACAVTLAAFALTAIIEYGLYAFDAAHLAPPLDWGGGALLLFMLAFGEFRLALQMRRPGLAAIAVAVLPLGMLAGFDWLARDDYDPDPSTEGLLYPPFARIAPARSPEAYDELLGSLFEAARND